MIRIEPIRIPGQIDPSTDEQQPDMLVPPDGIVSLDFHDGAYWVPDEGESS